MYTCGDENNEIIGGVPKSNYTVSWQVVEFDGWELRVSEVCLYLVFYLVISQIKTIT